MLVKYGNSPLSQEHCKLKLLRRQSIRWREHMKLHSHNYTVKMDLQDAEFELDNDGLAVFSDCFNKIGSKDSSFLDICSLQGSVLQYESETLLPENIDGSKEKVLMVLGNPATHSVQNGMFFYSKTNGDRLPFWGKMANAGLVHAVPKTTRDEEANLLREMILGGTSSDKYLIGLTTFYSFPTPGPDKMPFSGVTGVEKLFKQILEPVSKMETKRIRSYPFTDGAIVVFTQKTSFQRFSDISGIKPVYWPMRGSSGMALAELLVSAIPVNLKEDDPLSKFIKKLKITLSKLYSAFAKP